MNSVDQRYLSVICLLITLFISSFVFAGGVDELHILKISARDERAVIKTPDGKMHIIRIGDQIGENGRVVEIAKDRIVIEEEREKKSEKVIIRLENGKQRIERITKAADMQSMQNSNRSSEIVQRKKKVLEQSETE